MMVAYEIHTFRDGAWKIDSVFDDKDLAVLEAQRIERARRYAGVRVVEETFDEVTDRAVTRTIYRSRAARPVSLAPDATLPPTPLPVAMALAAAADVPVAMTKPRQSLTRLLVVSMLTLAAILFSSLGALYALNSLTK